MKKLLIMVGLLFAGLVAFTFPVHAAEGDEVDPIDETVEVIEAETPVDPLIEDESITEMFLELISSTIFWIIASVSALGIPGAIYTAVKIVGAFKSLKGKVNDGDLTMIELINEVKSLRTEMSLSRKESTDVKTALVGMITMMNMDGLKKQRLLEMLADPNKTATEVTVALEKEFGTVQTKAKSEIEDILTKLSQRV